MDPLISIVVATYRRKESLVQALESLALQTYKNYEIVLVDDNDEPSWNEAVSRIVKGFLQEHPVQRVKYLENHPNQGSAKTRNAGILAAEGEYITFLDDDDLYLPDKLQKQLDFMRSGDYDYSVTDLDLYNESGKLIDRRVRDYIRQTDRESLQRYHLMYHITGTDTMMFKKSYLLRIDGFAPIDVGDEYYLMQRAIEGNGKFGYLPGSDVKAFVHTGEGGLSSGEGKIRGENALFAYKKQYFHRVSAKDRRYIRMRHYAVLAFAELRRRKYLGFLGNAVCSLISAPVQCLTLLANRKIM